MLEKQTQTQSQQVRQSKTKFEANTIRRLMRDSLRKNEKRNWEISQPYERAPTRGPADPYPLYIPFLTQKVYLFLPLKNSTPFNIPIS